MRYSNMDIRFNNKKYIHGIYLGIEPAHLL